MRFLIINTDYPDFLTSLYASRPELTNACYDAQQKARMDTLFGVADFYTSNLRKLGHEAFDVHANNEILQKTWAREHDLKLASDTEWKFCRIKSVVPWIERKKDDSWFHTVLAAQIMHYKPDVVLNQAMDWIPSAFFAKMKANIRLLVGQHAATRLPESEDLSAYDLCISSFPPMVEWFRSKGLKAELIRLGFEARILKVLKDASPMIPISFIGSFQAVHSTRTELVENLCRKFEIKVWTPDLNRLHKKSAIRKSYAGTVWGAEMYQILHDSRITLNHHGNVPLYANNMRLYEATGVGTLLITDWKQNLNEMFTVDKEVVAYRTPEECAELIHYYLDHPDKGRAIAKAGQQRTLHDHTYAKRMAEFVEIVREM